MATDAAFNSSTAQVDNKAVMNEDPIASPHNLVKSTEATDDDEGLNKTGQEAATTDNALFAQGNSHSPLASQRRLYLFESPAATPPPANSHKRVSPSISPQCTPRKRKKRTSAHRADPVRVTPTSVKIRCVRKETPSKTKVIKKPAVRKKDLHVTAKRREEALGPPFSKKKASSKESHDAQDLYARVRARSSSIRSEPEALLTRAIPRTVAVERLLTLTARFKSKQSFIARPVGSQADPLKLRVDAIFLQAVLMIIGHRYDVHVPLRFDSGEQDAIIVDTHQQAEIPVSFELDLNGRLAIEYRIFKDLGVHHGTDLSIVAAEMEAEEERRATQPVIFRALDGSTREVLNGMREVSDRARLFTEGQRLRNVVSGMVHQRDHEFPGDGSGAGDFEREHRE